MDLPAFLDALDRFGADFAAWPVDLRADAESLQARSPTARQAAATMGELERMLRATSFDTVAGFDDLAAIAMRHRQDRPSFPMARSARRAALAAGAVAMLGLGLVIGWGASEPDEGPDHALAVALDTTGSIDVD